MNNPPPINFQQVVNDMKTPPTKSDPETITITVSGKPGDTPSIVAQFLEECFRSKGFSRPVVVVVDDYPHDLRMSALEAENVVRSNLRGGLMRVRIETKRQSPGKKWREEADADGRSPYSGSAKLPRMDVPETPEPSIRNNRPKPMA